MKEQPLGGLRGLAPVDHGDKSLIREALQAAHRAKLAGREEDRDLLHRLIARIEGPEYDGLS